MRLPSQDSVIRVCEIGKFADAKEPQGIIPSATCTPWYPDQGALGICRRECCSFRGVRTRCETEYKVCGT